MRNRQPILVIKNDHSGQQVWQYPGEVIERGPDYVVLEAAFNRDDHDSGYIVWRRGDRFVEYFYADRWYNIFEIHDVADDRIKGWYCNLTRPAVLTGDEIASDDLALDVFIYPDGRTQIADQDEFDGLPISAEDRAQVTAALRDLLGLVERRAHPFTAIQDNA